MPTQQDLDAAEKRLRAQLKQVRLARMGLPHDGSVVMTQADVARHFGVQRSTVHDWLKKADFPCKAAPFDIHKIEQWKAQQDIDSDLLVAGGDSPWLEQLRKMKALQEEIKLEQLRGSVMEVDRVREALARWAAIIKRAGERIGIRYGPDAKAMLDDAIEECRIVVKNEFDYQHSEQLSDNGNAGLVPVDGESQDGAEHGGLGGS